MSLTAKDVAEIMRLLEDSSFDTLDLEVGDMRLSLRRGEGGIAAAEDRPVRARTPAIEAAPASEPTPASRHAPSSDPSLVDVPSPLLGVFYRQPKPGEPPFVEPGATVGPDTVIAIIEVMKLMNSVRAGVSGEVAEILAVNGALVEYGEPLIRVRKAD